MKLQEWCLVHWNALRTAIEARELGGLIARDGAGAAAMMADELRVGTARDREGFDPLLRAWAMISTRALDMGAGLAGCPLCYVQRHHDECHQPGCAKPSVDDWIAGCTESLRRYAQELGLIPREPMKPC